MNKLQKEHYMWIQKKYPHQSTQLPALGCLEEAGELIHALLKMAQVQIWGEDNRYKLIELRQKLSDAIGDCGIYACSLCNANEWCFSDIWDSSIYISTCNDIATTYAIRLVRAATDVALDPTNIGLLREYLRCLKAVSYLLGLNAETVIYTTWQIVKER